MEPNGNQPRRQRKKPGTQKRSEATNNRTNQKDETKTQAAAPTTNQ